MLIITLFNAQRKQSNLKLLEHTNWKQNYNIQKGLLDTINCFKEPKNLIRYKSEIYNI